MKIKKITAAFLVCGMLAMPCRAAVINTPEFNAEKTSVKIAGELGADRAEAKINVVILRTEGTASDFLNTENILDAVQISAEADGTYSASVPFDKTGNRPGLYNVYISGDDITEEESAAPKSFFFATEAYESTYVSAVNTAAQSGDVNALCEKLYLDNAEILEINSEAFISADTNEKKTAISGIAMSNLKKTPLTLEDIKETVREAAAILSLNSGLTQKVVNSDGLFLDEALEKNSTLQSFFALYKNTVSQSARSNVINAVSNKGFKDTKEFEKVFSENVFLCSIYNAKTSGGGHIPNIILTVGSSVGLDVSAFSALDEDKRLNVASELLAAGARNDMASFISTFEPIVAAQTGTKGGQTVVDRPSGGGGGMSVGAGAGSTTPGSSVNNETGFTDMSGYSWAQDAVNMLLKRNIVSGVGNNTFEPARDVLREEFIKMTVLLLGIKINAETDTFSDVEKGAWYNPYVAAAYENGIILGRSDGKFGTGEYITREDCAVILARALKISDDSAQNVFTDKGEISDYAENAISAMNKRGIINGMEDGSFRPKKSCSRAEAAVMLARIAQGEGI